MNNKPKIIIVEDELIIASDIEHILKKRGYIVVDKINSSEKALSKIAEYMPDIVLMDVMLNGQKDGIQIAEYIKKNLNIPVIYITAYNDDETLQRAKVTEPFGYILKPFEERELYSNIEMALYKHKADMEIKKRQELLEKIAAFDNLILSLSINSIIQNSIDFIKKEFNINEVLICLREDQINENFNYCNKLKIYLSQDESNQSFYDGVVLNSNDVFFNDPILNNSFKYIENINLISRNKFEEIIYNLNYISYLIIPLNVEKNNLGFLILLSKKINGIDKQTIDIINIISSRLTLSLQNAKYYLNIQESNEKYKNLANSLPQLICEFDLQGNINFINDNGLEMLGYTQKDISLNFYDFIYDPDKEKIKNLFTSINNKINREGVEISIKTKNDDLLPAVLYCNGIIKNNTVYGYRAIIIDISEKKRMQEELFKIKKLESVGILAGGISHDFNNFLTAILGNITLSKIYSNPDEKIYEILNEAEKACIRARDLTQQLLTFSKGGTPVKKIGSIENLVKESVEFILRGSKIKAVFDIKKDIWAVNMDQGQINQVINNIIINAMQAMPDGGNIYIILENFNYQDSNIYPVPHGLYIRLIIKDQGIGIPKENLSKIFDPYFTTKKMGSGLGLAVTYSIIKNHQGYIGVDSEVNKGTIVTILLPAIDTSINTKEEHIEIKNRKTGKILLMDDEELIRDVTGKMLKYLGYEVFFACDGNEAITIYENEKTNGKPFDLIIMDLTIPGGMGGKETLDILLKKYPDIKAIVSSGYSNDPILSNYKNYGFKDVIVKPYKIEDLDYVINKNL